MELIPAIDLIGGKIVRLQQGNFQRKEVYQFSPLEMAYRLEAAGIHRLHLVDLDGAKAGKVMQLPVLAEIATKTNLAIDFSGGIQSLEIAQMVLESGAKWISIGSMAVKNPAVLEQMLARFPDQILLGADAKAEKIAIHGWLEYTDISLFDFLQTWTQKGIKACICTDISKDGILEGSSIDLYKKILQRFPDLQLIASGGVSSLQELDTLKAIGCSGAIIGKAIYEEILPISTLQSWLQTHN